MKIKTIAVLFIFISISILSSCDTHGKTDTKDNDNLISPTYTEKTADQMDDSELINILQNNLYHNIRIIQDWICTGGTLQRESATTYDSGDNRADYQLISNIKDKSALEINIKSIFTDEYSEGKIYPLLFEGDLPLFVEVDGKLYNNANTGGALTYYPDFTRAKVTSKTADGFDVEVPITYIDDPEGKPYIYKIVLQDGKWLLANDYWFN